MIKFLEITLQL